MRFLFCFKQEVLTERRCESTLGCFDLANDAIDHISSKIEHFQLKIKIKNFCGVDEIIDHLKSREKKNTNIYNDDRTLLN